MRLFEQGMDFVTLLENEPMISIIKRVLRDDCHIISLQGRRMSKETEVSSWYADEIFLQRPADVPDSVAYPPIINSINCHYYVMDVPVELRPTQVVPFSPRQVWCADNCTAGVRAEPGGICGAWQSL